jgi:hypothetical protein
VGLVIAELEKLQGRKKLSTLEHKLKDQIKLVGGEYIVEWIIKQKMKMDCSTKDVNESFHKTKKLIVPQKQKIDCSTKTNKKIVPQRQKWKGLLMNNASLTN